MAKGECEDCARYSALMDKLSRTEIDREDYICWLEEKLQSTQLNARNTKENETQMLQAQIRRLERQIVFLNTEINARSCHNRYLRSEVETRCKYLQHLNIEIESRREQSKQLTTEVQTQLEEHDRLETGIEEQQARYKALKKQAESQDRNREELLKKLLLNIKELYHCPPGTNGNYPIRINCSSSHSKV